MKGFRIFAAACLVTLGLAGTAPAQRDNDNRQRQEDRWVRGRIGPQWELMTKQVVNFRDDRDHINVGDAGRHNGRFTRVMIRAEGAPVEIRRMLINFDNGEKFEAISQRTRLDQNSGGYVIDLPGHRRNIDSIDLNYFSVNTNQPGGRGTLLVYGTGSGGPGGDRQSDNRFQRGRVGGDWELMTKQVVNFRDDRDHINVGNAGRHNGRFTRVMVRAEGAPVEIRRMVINFDNGEKFEAVNRRTRLDDNGFVIDLPGHRRDIDSIDLDYFSVNTNQPGGRGTLLVYGSGSNRQAFNR
jgi:hypothetical protein